MEEKNPNTQTGQTGGTCQTEDQSLLTSAPTNAAPSIFLRAFPETYRIFGVQLVPFSLKHYQLLRRMGSPFVEEGESRADIGDLVLGILVCSMPVWEIVELLDDERAFKKELRRWGKRIRREVKAEPHFNLFSKFGLFKAYLEQANYVPRYWNEAGEPELALRAHWSHAVEVALRSQVGWSEQEIEETPLCKALADYFQWAQAEGLVRIMTEEEAEACEEQAEENLKAMRDSLIRAGIDPDSIPSDVQCLGREVVHGA